MTEKDLDRLEARAKAATPGPWDYGGCEVFLKGTDFWPVIATCRNEDDLAFIAAANPAVVLELIATIRKRDKAMQRLARALRIKTRALAIAQRECKHAQERAAQKEEKQ